MNPAARIQAVIFDLDGTLLDSEAIYEAGWLQAIKEFNLQLPSNFYHYLRGLTNAQSYELIVEQWEPALEVRRFEKRLLEITESLFEHKGVQLKPGVQEILSWCRARHLPAAVATSSPTADAVRHLKSTGIVSEFNHVCGRDLVINAKPAPDIYLYTARQLGIEPKHCLAIEDSVNGVRAAHAAGITTIMVAECKPAVEVQIEKITHRYFPTLHELRSYLDG